MQAVIELAPGEEREIVFMIGQSENVEEARSILFHIQIARR